MMKKGTIRHMFVRVLALGIVLASQCASALAYDAQTAAGWLTQFSAALDSLMPLNDPVLTADPARAGQFLQEYEFGTVTRLQNPSAEEILEIDMRTAQVTDCRGVRVGMPLEQAFDGTMPSYGASPLVVLATQEAGYGWSWAYMSDDGVYGVEYIAYGGDEMMKEYTLTYVIEHGVISAIRMKIADATLAQAQDGLETAEEIASRQDAGALIEANSQPMLTQDDLQIDGGRALGMPVEQLIALMGEPAQIQTLPQGTGRVLVYAGAVVTLGFNEATGEEIVRAVSVSSEAFEGPNRLRVGMSLGEAGGLLRCDQNIYSRGGTLYLEGEAQGEAPYGELQVLSSGELLLLYACQAEDDTALLQAIVQDGFISGWQMMYLSDRQGGV